MTTAINYFTAHSNNSVGVFYHLECEGLKVFLEDSNIFKRRALLISLFVAILSFALTFRVEGFCLIEKANQDDS